jgi:hypothetical protein
LPISQDDGAIPREGKWKIFVDGTDLDVEDTSFQLLVMLDNRQLSTDYQISGSEFGTGDRIPLHVTLREGDAPVLGASINAFVYGPRDGTGNILSTQPTPSGQPNMIGDSLRSAAQAKLRLLVEDPKTAGLFTAVGYPNIRLYDDGLAIHGDTAKDDGVYSAFFSGANQEGHYNFRFKVSGEAPENGEFRRTRTLSVFVRPKADLKSTVVKVAGFDVQPNGTVVLRLSVTPRDALGNYLGPDYLDHLVIESSGTEVAPLQDRLDGSYEASLLLPTVQSRPFVRVVVMGDTVFADTLAPLQYRWGASLHAGVALPHSLLAQDFDPSVSFGADLEYRLKGLFSVEIYGGHDRFKAKAGGDDYYITHVSGHGKLTMGPGPWSASVHVGAGAYWPKDSDTLFGWNAGGGVQYWPWRTLGIEAMYNYRNVDPSGSVMKYSTITGGLRLRL